MFVLLCTPLALFTAASGENNYDWSNKQCVSIWFKVLFRPEYSYQTLHKLSLLIINLAGTKLIKE